MSSLILNSAMMCGSLPPTTFFEPTEDFFKFLDTRFPNMPIIDVGAGQGKLSKALADRKRKVMAIDPYERDERVFNVQPFDGTSFSYPEGSLPIMARPCHGCWVENAIKQAVECCGKILYVGLPKNFDDDLYELDKEFNLVYHEGVVGEDGEVIVEITKR